MLLSGKEIRTLRKTSGRSNASNDHSVSSGSERMRFSVLVYVLFVAVCSAEIDMIWTFSETNDVNIQKMCGRNGIHMDVLFTANNEASIHNYLQKVCHPNYQDGILKWFLYEIEYCNMIISSSIYKKVSSSRNVVERETNWIVRWFKTAIYLVCNVTQYEHNVIPDFDNFEKIFRLFFDKNTMQRTDFCDGAREVFDKHSSLCNVLHIQERIDESLVNCAVKLPHRLLNPTRLFVRFTAENCTNMTEVFANSSIIGHVLTSDSLMHLEFNAIFVDWIREGSELLLVMKRTRLLLNQFGNSATHFNYEFDELYQQFLVRYYALIRQNSSDLLKGNSSVEDDDANFSDRILTSLLSKINENRLYFSSLCTEFHISKLLTTGLSILLLTVNTYLIILLLKAKRRLSAMARIFVLNITLSNYVFALSSFTSILFGFLFHNNEDLHSGYLFVERNPLVISDYQLQGFLEDPYSVTWPIIQDFFFAISQNCSLIGFLSLLALLFHVLCQSSSCRQNQLSKRVIIIFSLCYCSLLTLQPLFTLGQFWTLQKLSHFYAVSVPEYDGRATNLKSNGDTSTCSYLKTVAEPITVCDQLENYRLLMLIVLRGQTVFTVIFIGISIVIFIALRVLHSRWIVQSRLLRSDKVNASRQLLFQTLSLSLLVLFVSVIGQTLLEFWVFSTDNQETIAYLSRYYHWTRMISFADPLINPIIAIIRIPALRGLAFHHVHAVKAVFAKSLHSFSTSGEQSIRSNDTTCECDPTEVRY